MTVGKVQCRARIPDLDLDATPTRPHAEQNFATRGVLNRVGQQVLEHATQQARIGIDEGAGRHDAELEALRPRHRLEGERELRHQLAERDRAAFRFELAGVEPRNIEQRAEDFLDRLEGAVDVVGEALGIGRQRPLDQARRIEPCRIQRLEQIVARRREETRLGEIGVAQRLVDARQLGGPFGDAALERLVGAGEGLRRRYLIGDVEIGRDDATLRHRRGADFEDATRRREVFQKGFTTHRELQEALADVGFDRARAEVAALGAVTQDLLQRHADLSEVSREVQEFAVLAVPADQAHVAVEHAEPVAHLIERRLKKVAVVLERLGSIVEQS